MNNGYVVTTQVRQRWDMNFRHYNYMDRPVGPRMVKRQHLVRLSHDLDRRSTAQGFVTIEVVRHWFFFTGQALTGLDARQVFGLEASNTCAQLRGSADR